LNAGYFPTPEVAGKISKRNGLPEPGVDGRNSNRYDSIHHSHKREK
jgi:hypothetical protein